MGQSLARVYALTSVWYLLKFIYADIFQEYGKIFNSSETTHAHTTYSDNSNFIRGATVSYRTMFSEIAFAS